MADPAKILMGNRMNEVLKRLLDPLFVRRRKRLFAAVQTGALIDPAKLRRATQMAEEYLQKYAGSKPLVETRETAARCEAREPDQKARGES